MMYVQNILFEVSLLLGGAAIPGIKCRDRKPDVSPLSMKA